MNGLPAPAPDSNPPAVRAPAPPGRLRRLREAVLGLGGRFVSRRISSEVRLARILDLFEEHVYAGEITPDGRYVHHTSTATLEGLIGGRVPDGRRDRRVLGVAHPGRGPGARTRRSTAAC